MREGGQCPILLLCGLLVASSAIAQEHAGTIPEHGLQAGLEGNWQWPGKVVSEDGSDEFVRLSSWAGGYRISLFYSRTISERSAVCAGLQVGRASYTFEWGGDQIPLGPFGGAEGSYTGFVEHWEVRGVAAGFETALLSGQRLRLLVAMGARFEMGSGGTTFVWREDVGTGPAVEMFRYDARFNQDNRVMSTLWLGPQMEWVMSNSNRIRAGIGCNLVLDHNVLQGTYFTRTRHDGYLSGQFSSSMSSLYASVGHVWTWGYPKVPRKMRL